MHPPLARLRGALGLASCLLAPMPSLADALPWKDEPFAYVAQGQTVDRVLAGIARALGVVLQLEFSPSDLLVEWKGRAQASSPGELLDTLCAAHGLAWYYHGGTLYVSQLSQRSTRLVRVPGIAPDALKKALEEIGVLDTRFGWAELDRTGAALVSGPTSYVERVIRQVEALAPARIDQEVMVFRLRHAPVQDRLVQYRDRQVLTPGVATLLRNLLSDRASSVGAAPLELSRVWGKDAVPGSNAELGAMDPGLAARFASRPLSAGTGETRPPPPTIEADPRMNALIIRDQAHRAPMYGALIEELDKPSQLIRIEVTIADVNRSRSEELGIDWSASRGRLAGGFGAPSQATDGATLAFSGGRSLSPLAVAADAASLLTARLKLLESRGDARVVSEPFILTLDNAGALIDVSDTFYVATPGEHAGSVTGISVGTTLRVTPHVIGGMGPRAVQLLVDIEDGAIQDLRIGNLPTIRRSVMSTQAIVGEQGSLVIGGLKSEQQLHQTDQVPLLGDLPIVGAAFRKKSSRESRTERLFIITPRIVEDAWLTGSVTVGEPQARAPDPAPPGPSRPDLTQGESHETASP